MVDISLWNLFLYLLQTTLVVGAASVTAPLLNAAPARARLAYWRAVVVICFLLPLAPMRHVDAVTRPTERTPERFDIERAALPMGGASTRVDTQALPETLPFRSAMHFVTLLPILLLAGIAGRAAWTTTGCIRLRQLRRQGRPAVLDDDVMALRQQLAPRAELKWHDEISQPVTFGVRPPIVMLPTTLAGMPADLQRAAVCHELLHVKRRDWLWTVAEEAIRTFFWFHPAIRWALGQIQLSREQTVDALVVSLVGGRRSYMSALLIFAGQPAVAPATPFLRRRQLLSRIKMISRDVRMSSIRLALTGTGLAAVLIASSVGAVGAVPLHASLVVPAARPLTRAAVSETLSVEPQHSGGFVPGVVLRSDEIRRPPIPSVSRPATATTLNQGVTPSGPVAVQRSDQEPAATPPEPAEFDVASIKQNPSGNNISFPTITERGRVAFSNVTLRSVILMAYGIDVRLARFIVVPEDREGWGAPHFDIMAVPPDNPGAGRRQSLVMLRALLAERFGLRVHTETREIPVYAVTVAREDGRLGSGLRPSTHSCSAFQVGRSEGRLTLADEPVDANGVGLCLPSRTVLPGTRRIRWAGPLGQLFGQIAGLLDRPLVDATDLTGNYEWNLVSSVVPERANLDAPSIYTAIPEQLGLRLERRTAPYEVLVIDSVNQMPTPN